MHTTQVIYIAIVFIIGYYLLRRIESLCGCGPKLGNSPIANKGMFASQDYKMGDLIEECPSIAVNASDILGKNKLQDYVFQSRNPLEVLVPLANCGLYNHSETSNAFYTIKSDGSINVYATNNITKGEEILINYGNGYWLSRGLTPS